MKYSFQILIFNLLIIFQLIYTIDSSPSSNYQYQVKYFQQKVDHFNYLNNNYTFKQRYIIADRYYRLNGPIWFYAGNEGNIFTFVNNTGIMWDNAEKFNATIIFMEHRYYGKSLPLYSSNKSFENLKYLQYLNVEQAIADYANFLFNFKYNLNSNGNKYKNSPIILFGGSYGGMLATYFRIKYPQLCIGAVASSAPILQLPNLTNCENYMKISTKDFENYSAKCSNSIRKSWSIIRRLATTKNGLKFLQNTFNLCTELTTENLQKFIDWLKSIWTTLPMIDYPNAANFLTELPAYPIKVICENFKNDKYIDDDENLIRLISKSISIYTNYTGQTKCNQFVADINDKRLGIDAWNFQSCTEMLLPICSNGRDDMFEPDQWSMKKITEDCRKKFDGINPDSDKIRWMFGIDQLKLITSNIIFSNGDRDPWSGGGVLHSLSDTLIAIRIPGACHHEDLRSQGPNDSKELIEAREKILNIIRKWLDDYYRQTNIQFNFNF